MPATGWADIGRPFPEMDLHTADDGTQGNTHDRMGHITDSNRQMNHGKINRFGLNGKNTLIETGLSGRDNRILFTESGAGEIIFQAKHRVGQDPVSLLTRDEYRMPGVTGTVRVRSLGQTAPGTADLNLISVLIHP